MTSIKEQLAGELAEVTWSDLVPHSRRDAIISIAGALDLVEVGEAFASDNVALVQYWIKEGLIEKPSQKDLSDWNGEPGKLFKTLIVQPFVIVQAV